VARPLAVITGASSGIGMVFAQKLAPDHDLLLIARRKDRLAALAADLAAKFGSAVSALAYDLTDDAALTAVAQRIANEPKLALLVNNAGFGVQGRFWESDPGAQERMHRLHITATMQLTHAALRNMTAKNSGAIINVASVAAFVRPTRGSSYGATKSWMTAFTEGLHLELRSAGSAVRVQALCPGYTYSEFHDSLKMDREQLAPSWLWLQPGFVVDESLKGLRRGKLFVTPAWPYRLVVAVAPKLPTALRLAVEGARGKRQKQNR
jgi:short-subunit dehydrogenase